MIGAGATGTELAAELHRTAREVIAYGLDRVNPDRDVKIILIEAANRILPALPQAMSGAALKLLQGIGIEVRTGTPVSEVTADGVQTRQWGFYPFRTGRMVGGSESARFPSPPGRFGKQ